MLQLPMILSIAICMFCICIGIAIGAFIGIKCHELICRDITEAEEESEQEQYRSIHHEHIDGVEFPSTGMVTFFKHINDN